MASQPQPPRPETRTASRSVLQTARATHAFEVTQYSQQLRRLRAGEFVPSAAFDVGGYRWCLRFYPSGDGGGPTDHVAVFLELLTKGAEAAVLLDFRLVDHTTGASCSFFCSESQSMFSTMEPSDARSTWGRRNLMKRSELEESAYLRDDALVIECDVTVFRETRVLIDASEDDAGEAPPLELSDDHGRLLETGEEADVTFAVGAEDFAAHRAVLAARSPVFRAALYGPLGKDRRDRISVEDMQPAIFMALLRFVYTDSLPAMEHLEDEQIVEKVKHLLVAADRYAVDRLKLICEGILCKSVDACSVADMLVLADQYSCRKLRAACQEYVVSSRTVDDPVSGKKVMGLLSWLALLWNMASSSRRKWFSFLPSFAKYKGVPA